MANAEMLQPYVEQEIARFLGIDTVTRDEDGDIPIRFGSAVCFARLFDGPAGPIFRVFAPLLGGVDATVDLFARLNQLNLDSVLLRFFWNENVVLCTVDLPAQNLQYSEIADAVGAVAAWADELDDLLKAEFGGQLLAEEEDDSGQTVDQEGLIAWISEQTEIPSTVVAPVLEELEFEYLVGVGIVEDPGYEFRYYSPERLAGKSKIVDTQKLVQDAEQMLGTATETAEAIYEAETRFLKMRGIIS